MVSSPLRNFGIGRMFLVNYICKLVVWFLFIQSSKNHLSKTRKLAVYYFCACDPVSCVILTITHFSTKQKLDLTQLDLHEVEMMRERAVVVRKRGLSILLVLTPWE